MSSAPAGVAAHRRDDSSQSGAHSHSPLKSCRQSLYDPALHHPVLARASGCAQLFHGSTSDDAEPAGSRVSSGGCSPVHSRFAFPIGIPSAILFCMFVGSQERDCSSSFVPHCGIETWFASSKWMRCAPSRPKSLTPDSSPAGHVVAPVVTIVVTPSFRGA